MFDRRAFLITAAALAARPAFAQEAPAAILAYERASGGRIGVYAENVATGAKLSWRADERFVMCSTFKASLAAFTLARVDRGEDRLDAMIPFGRADLIEHAPAAEANLAKGAMSVAEMCEAAVELSDNACANLLLARAGGPAAMTGFWRAIGDTVSRLDHNEPELNRSKPGDPRDTTTPASMAGILRRLVLEDVLSPTSRELFTAWLVDNKTGAKRLRAGLPKDWRIGDKTGNNGRDAAADIAVTWTRAGAPILIAAYTQRGAPTQAHFEAVFSGVGRLVAERLG